MSKTVEFVVAVGSYDAGDTGEFSDATAQHFIVNGVAVPVETVKAAPKKRATRKKAAPKAAAKAATPAPSDDTATSDDDGTSPEDTATD